MYRTEGRHGGESGSERKKDVRKKKGIRRTETWNCSSVTNRVEWKKRESFSILSFSASAIALVGLVFLFLYLKKYEVLIGRWSSELEFSKRNFNFKFNFSFFV